MAECGNEFVSWTVDQLKAFLRERQIPLSGNKTELVKKVADMFATDSLENEIEAVPFDSVEYSSPPNFNDLPGAGWASDGFPIITESAVTDYLKTRSGYTKNFRTGVRLCQCGHLFGLEVVSLGNGPTTVYIKAKCRPTMRQVPPFYTLFVILTDGTPTSGNCKCPAGESQTCVHIAALFIMLSEISPQACTSVRCAWSKPSQGGKASLVANLDFGKASSEGYTAYNGPVQPVDGLLDLLQDSEHDVGILEFQQQESERCECAIPPPSCNPVLTDPLDKLSEIATTRDVTVYDLVNALQPTEEEVQLMQEMTIGQHNNPLWFDARQWRITLSNFGKVCNRQFRQLYPPSLVKSILGDYGTPHTAAIQWGWDHEANAICSYTLKTQRSVVSVAYF